jgi:hypothetical protein
MTRRRTPVETAFTSTVAYPSALFSLGKDEVFPYERFAYNLLNEAVHALHSKGLPERIFVDFERPLQGLYPWSINSTISFELDDKKQPTAFHFVTPELVPAILYLYSAVVLSEFNDNDDADKSQSGPGILVHQIHRFVDAANAGIRGYLESGFGKAVRSSYDNHEIAHAYVRQITRQPKPSGTEIVAFEFLADLVATDWFFTKMIGNTPDTEVYRNTEG